MRRSRRRGERPGRRRPLLPLPSPSPPLGGLLLGPAAAPLGSSAGLREFSVPPPRPSPPGQRGRGGPGGPTAASAQRKLYPNKISSSFPIVTVPGQVAQDGQKLQPAETQEEEKTVSGAAAAAASIPAARKRPGWLPGGATLAPLLPQFRAEPFAAAASARRRKGASPHCQHHCSSLKREWTRGRGTF